MVVNVDRLLLKSLVFAGYYILDVISALFRGLHSGKTMDSS